MGAINWLAVAAAAPSSFLLLDSHDGRERSMATPQEQEAAMILRLPEQTGRTLDEWLKLVQASGLTAHGKIVALLKTEHDVTHGYANLIAHKALRSRRRAGPRRTS